MKKIALFPFMNLLFPLFLAGLFLASCGGEEKTTDDSKAEEGVWSREESSFQVGDEQLQAQGLTMASAQKLQKPQLVYASGMVDLPPENRHNISAITAAFISKINRISGDKVNKGDVLFTLMNPDFLELQRALVEAKNTFELAEKEWNRVQSFKEDNIVSTKQYDQAKADFSNTKADYHSQRKYITLLGLAVESVEKGEFTAEIIVKSPVSGVISSVHVSKGTFVERSASIMEILATEHFHVELAVFEAEAGLIKEGQELWVNKQFSGGTEQWVKGYVFRVNPSFTDGDKQLSVHAHVEEWDNPIIGSYVQAKIQTNIQWYWRVPISATQKTIDGIALLRADKLDGNIWQIGKILLNNDGFIEDENPNFLLINESVVNLEGSSILQKE